MFVCILRLFAFNQLNGDSFQNNEDSLSHFQFIGHMKSPAIFQPPSPAIMENLCNFFYIIANKFWRFQAGKNVLPVNIFYTFWSGLFSQ